MYSDGLSEHTVNTTTDIMTYTGPGRWLYNHDRLQPTTFYPVYTIIHSHLDILKIHGRVL